jgi:hypothetical protein
MQIDEGEDRPRFFMPGHCIIIHPYAGPRLSWDVYVILLLIYTVFQVPAAIAFEQQVFSEPMGLAELIVTWIVDASFWADMLLNFRTAVVDPNSDSHTQLKFITDWKIIAKWYFKGWFWIDLLGSIPTSLVELILSSETASATASGDVESLNVFKLGRMARLVRLFKLLRLARLGRWNRLISKAKDTLAMNPGHMRIIKCVMFVMVLAHLFACGLYALVTFETEYERTWASDVTTVIPGLGVVVLHCPVPREGDDTNNTRIGWRLPTSLGHTFDEPADKSIRRVVLCWQADGPYSGQYLEEASAYAKYVISLYVTFTTLTTVGYGDITMRTSPELIFGITMMAAGASTFAVVVGNMAAVLGKLDVRARIFKEHMEDLDDFMHQENLPLDLRFRTRTFFDYMFNHSRDIPESIGELSTSLRTDVAMHLYNDLITTVPFFRECGRAFLTEVILRLRSQTLSPGDFLYEAGEAGDCMFFLVKGSVEVVLDERLGVYAELREGCYFGENCVLGLSATRPLSVRGCAWCSLFFLTQEALEDCLVQHPEAHEHFRRLVISQTVEKAVSLAIKRLKMKQLMEANPDDPKVSFGTRLGLFWH